MFAPIVSVGAVMGLSSACAISAASDAATEVESITADATTLADLLPSSDDVPCSTCELVKPDPVAVVARIPQKSPEVEPQNKVSDATADFVELPENAAVAASAPGAVPLDAPRCEGISAYIITVFDNAKHSVASLTSDPRRQAIRRREGQMFGEHRVAKIDFNRRNMSSAVWLESDAGLCQVLLRESHPQREKINRAALRRQERQARKLRQKIKKRKKKNKRNRKRR